MFVVLLIADPSSQELGPPGIPGGSVIARDVITCDYGLCVYREIVAIPLEGSEVQALTASTNTAPGAVLSFRLKAQSGIDWDDDIPLAELAGVSRVVADYRQKAGIQ